MRRGPGLGGLIGRSSPERFETMTLTSLAFCFLFVPLLAAPLIDDPTSGRQIAFIIGTLVATVVVGGAFLVNVDVYRGTAAPRWGWIGAAVVALLALLVIVLAAYPAWGHDRAGDSLGIVLALGLALAIPLVSLRALLFGAIGTVVAAGLMAWAMRVSPAERLSALLLATGLAVVVLFTLRASLWMLGVVWELQDRREIDARLAVAEERLRFSRDLHDVYGRTLSAVAVKSELAAALARRSDAASVEEMLDVRRIANEALREVRAIVQGYRSPDLMTELDGARSILRSTGVDVRVAGEEIEIPTGAASALAWAVREGVTNVVRHSSASECELRLGSAGDRATLTIDNDGAGPGGEPAGSGLSGLTERLAAVGGTVRTEHEGDRFRLYAEVPMSAPVGEGAR